MKQVILPILCVLIIACNRDKTLTDRQKLDSIQPGMTLSEVLAVYGPMDTANRSSIAGQCGGVLDTVTLQVNPGPEGYFPLISVTMKDTTTLLFTRGKLMMKPEKTWEEIKKDTFLYRILSSGRP